MKVKIVQDMRKSWAVSVTYIRRDQNGNDLNVLRGSGRMFGLL